MGYLLDEIQRGDVIRHRLLSTKIPQAKYSGEYRIVTGGVLIKVTFPGESDEDSGSDVPLFAWWNIRNCMKGQQHGNYGQPAQ